MKETTLFIALSLALICCNNQEEKDWHRATEPYFKNKVYKQEGKIAYYFDRSIKTKDREATINRCKEYIKNNLRIINESEISDSARICFFKSKKELSALINGEAVTRFFPYYMADVNTVLSLYGDKCPINYGLMSLAIYDNWDDPADGLPQAWISGGLATYAAPDAECYDLSYEKKYTAILQNNKLLTTDSLISNFRRGFDYQLQDYSHIKICYSQSAYMVQYMIENYGIEKVKEFWQNGMHKFEDIFGVTIYTMVDDIEKKLKEKYPEPIEFDWKKFEEKCY